MRKTTMIPAATALVMLSATAGAGTPQLFEPVAIATGTYLLAPTIPGEAHVGIVIGARSVAIIGAPKSGVYGRRILAHVAELTDKPVSHVIVLSQFCDHACGSAELDAQATVVASDQLDPTPPYSWSSKLDEGPEYYVGAGIAAPELPVSSSVTIDLGGRTLVVSKVAVEGDPAALVVRQEDVAVTWAGPRGLQRP